VVPIRGVVPIKGGFRLLELPYIYLFTLDETIDLDLFLDPLPLPRTLAIPNNATIKIIIAIL